MTKAEFVNYMVEVYGEHCRMPSAHAWDEGLVSPMKVRDAVIRKEYLKRRHTDKAVDIVFSLTERFGCCERTVNKAIYGK
jgi:hypothetical protein